MGALFSLKALGAVDCLLPPGQLQYNMYLDCDSDSYWQGFLERIITQ